MAWKRRESTMTPDDVKALAAAGESETLEFKETTGQRRLAAKTVCAFLNQRGGKVLSGVNQDGVVVGQQVGKNTIEDISRELRLIQPPVFPGVERVNIGENHDAIVVSASKGPLRPYTYRDKSYKRVGSTTTVISADEYNRILVERMHKEERWENQPATGWSIDDLDADEIRHTIAEAARRRRLAEPATREVPDMLRGLGLLRDGVLLRAAVVLFGDSERLISDMPQCLLRVARFRGLDKMEFLDNRQFIGNAFTLLANAELFLQETLPIAGRFERDRFERIDEPLYPVLATREALANALCHRDYSVGGSSIGVAVYDDRLEITSPGSLHFGLTPEKLFTAHESKPWNPLIAHTFYRRGIIEEWGSGTLNMVKSAKDAGIPAPEIEDNGGYVTVRFRHRQPLPQPFPQRSLNIGPDELSREIFAMISRAEDGLTRREILARLSTNVSKRKVRRILEALKYRGFVVPVGHGRGARWMSERADTA